LDTGNKSEGFKDSQYDNTDYTYDKNGNMEKDANKGITDIHYNYLNLPDTVKFSNNNTMIFTYDATGNKLGQEVISDTLHYTTEYMGALFLKNDTLQFINTAEGRAVPNGSAWEYQYYLKDHLGNVRTTFTTAPKTETYSTSFETATVPDGYFDNYEDQHRDSYTARTGSYSSRLSYDDNLLIGLAKSLKVYPGDTVRATAYARVLDNSTEDISDLFTTLASGFSGAFANTTLGIEGQATSISDLVYPASGTGGLLDKDDSDATPKLYLNLLYFDKDMNFITGDYARTSAGATSAFEELSLEVLVPQEGYVLIYVSNEEEQANIAYFDDVSIEHNHSAVIQEESYYPFGMSQHYSYQRDLSKDQRFGYNGVEFNDIFQVYETLFRGYDPTLGRFMQVDPLADFMPGISPYSFGFNNPISYGDPAGLGPIQNLFQSIAEGFMSLFGKRKMGEWKAGNVRWVDKAGKGKGRKSNKSKKSKGNNDAPNSIVNLPDPSIPLSDFAEFNAPRTSPDELIMREKLDKDYFEFGDEIYKGEAGTSFEYNKNIFELNKPSLSTSGIYQFKGDLRNFVKYITSKPELKLSVMIGTAMSESSAKYSENPHTGESNFNLYNARAKAIYDALHKMGVPLNQLKLKPVDWGSYKRVELKLIE
jgi:RHS repeat-associated protein